MLVVTNLPLLASSCHMYSTHLKLNQNIFSLRVFTNTAAPKGDMIAFENCIFI